MTVALKGEMERFVEDQVKAGRFSSAEDVVEAGLARLMLDSLENEFGEEDITAINRSLEQVARGEDLDWKQVSADLRKRFL